MIQNEVVRGNFIKQIILALIGLLLVIPIVFFQRKESALTTQAKEDAIPFAAAYSDDMLEDEEMKSTLVYVDITEKPIDAAYYEGKEHYYIIMDENGWYILRAYEDTVKSLNQKIEENGYARVTGSVEKVDREILDIIAEEFEEAELLTREEFDQYFSGVGIFEGYSTDEASDYSLLASVLSIVAVIFFGLGIIGTFRFLAGLGKLSPMEKEIVAAQLQDPRTIYIKVCKVYLTPEYIVYAGRGFEAIKYIDCIWSYKYSRRINLIPVAAHVRICTRNRKTIKIAHTFTFSNAENMGIEQIFRTIKTYNPVACFGYTNEARNYYNSGVWNRPMAS